MSTVNLELIKTQLESTTGSSSGVNDAKAQMKDVIDKCLNSKNPANRNAVDANTFKMFLRTTVNGDPSSYHALKDAKIDIKDLGVTTPTEQQALDLLDGTDNDGLDMKKVLDPGTVIPGSPFSGETTLNGAKISAVDGKMVFRAAQLSDMIANGAFGNKMQTRDADEVVRKLWTKVEGTPNEAIIFDAEKIRRLAGMSTAETGLPVEAMQKMNKYADLMSVVEVQQNIKGEGEAYVTKASWDDNVLKLSGTESNKELKKLKFADIAGTAPKIKLEDFAKDLKFKEGTNSDDFLEGLSLMSDVEQAANGAYDAVMTFSYDPISKSSPRVPEKPTIAQIKQKKDGTFDVKVTNTATGQTYNLNCKSIGEIEDKILQKLEEKDGIKSKYLQVQMKVNNKFMENGKLNSQGKVYSAGYKTLKNSLAVWLERLRQLHEVLQQMQQFYAGFMKAVHWVG